MIVKNSTIVQEAQAAVQHEAPKVVQISERVQYYAEHKTVIDTLYIVEDFEPDFLELYLPIVSLNTLQCRNWKNLHKELKQVIENCLVKNIVLVLSKKALTIDTKAIEAKQDLSDGLNNYFQSIFKFRELLKKTKTNPGLYISFVNHTDSNSSPELKEAFECFVSLDVYKSIQLFDKPKQGFFETTKVTNTTKSLHKVFLLHDAEKFYDAFADLIEDIEFIYKGDLYRWDNFDSKLKLQQPKWAKRVKWVGDNYYEEVEVPVVLQVGNTEDNLGEITKLKQIQTATLSRRFGGDFSQYLDYFQDFTNIPNHFNYQRILQTNSGRLYNRYFPFEWEPKKGEFPTIMRLIQHIFGDEEKIHKGSVVKSWEMGLDYVQLLLLKPVLRLPVLCLYSPENNTGKSTFAFLLSNIFKNNCVPVSNDDFQSEFGASIYYDKLVAYCEESLLERVKDVERIKNISTAAEVSVNPKGTTQFKGQTFVKFIFMSNRKRMIHVSKHDERFWILRVPPVPIDERDPEMNEKLIAEIPAFIDFLKNRKMATAYESRMWFNPKLIRTDQFNEMARVSEHGDVRELRQKLEEYFVAHDCERLEIPTDVVKKYFLNKDTNWLNEILRDRLDLDKVRNDKGKVKTVRAKFEWWPEGAEDSRTITWKPAQCWVFHRKDFLPEQEPTEHEPKSDKEWQEFVNEEHQKI